VRLDEQELVRWGRRIGETIDRPVVIALRGPLGAGKSVLARAVGAGAGVTGTMPSPSYNLLLRYETGAGTAVVHLDLYRLESPDELWELGWTQLGERGEIVLVEWPERAGDLMPPDHWVIELSIPEGAPTLRDVEVHRVGSPPELPAFPLSLVSRG
jgi:tRNA threonylcarbamoyladenosine biosynthesis protein TsaE